MPKKPEQVTTRAFVQGAGLSDEARHAVNAVFDSMSSWRSEIASSSEKNMEDVIVKMAEAARALGWPPQIVEVSRAQFQNLGKMRIQIMDQMMDAWEEQIKSPSPMTASSALLSRIKALPSLGPAGTDADAWGTAMTNPMQFWMQSAAQLQKGWAQAFDLWVGQRHR